MPFRLIRSNRLNVLRLTQTSLDSKATVTHDSEKRGKSHSWDVPPVHEAHLLWAGLQQVSTERPAQQKLYRVTADLIYISRPKVSMGFKLMDKS